MLARLITTILQEVMQDERSKTSDGLRSKQEKGEEDAQGRRREKRRCAPARTGMLMLGWVIGLQMVGRQWPAAAQGGGERRGEWRLPPARRRWCSDPVEHLFCFALD